MRPTAWALLLMILVTPTTGRADGGTVRASRRVGDYTVTVFTAPTPLMTGPVDVSVLIQDAAGRPLQVHPVEVKAWPSDSPHLAVEGAATTEAATNKLFRAVSLPLAEPGPWVIEVAVTFPDGPARVRCSVDVAAPPPSWLDLLPWIAWPLVPCLVFVVRELVSRPRRAAGSGT